MAFDLCFIGVPVMAQETVATQPGDSLSTQAIDAKLLNLRLPALDVFLQTAEMAPSVLRSKAYESEQKHRLDVTRKEWLNNIRGNANYSYGSMGSMTESSATGQGTYFQYYGEIMSVYNLGGSVTIPLDLFFGRKDRILANKDQIKQAEYQTLQYIEDRKIVITELYATIVSSINMLKITVGAYTIADANVKLGEMEYINNSITLQVLSERRRDYTLAAASYEESKATLFKAVLQLEMATGIKLIQ
jgi:outer membrane protein TolC